MPWLRIGSRPRWRIQDPKNPIEWIPRNYANDADIAEAVKDLTLRRGERGVSVFRIESASTDTKQIAAL